MVEYKVVKQRTLSLLRLVVWGVISIEEAVDEACSDADAEAEYLSHPDCRQRFDTAWICNLKPAVV